VAEGAPPSVSPYDAMLARSPFGLSMLALADATNGSAPTEAATAIHCSTRAFR
jgi:hypothetical protein